MDWVCRVAQPYSFVIAVVDLVDNRDWNFERKRLEGFIGGPARGISSSEASSNVKNE